MYAKYKVPMGAACNHGWLSVLENDTKTVMEPMIFGPERGAPQSRTLTSGEQQLLATWAVKTALMLDLGTQPHVIPRFSYEQLRLYRCPLPNTIVLLGANRGDSRAIRVAHGGRNLGTVPAGAHDAFMTTITVFRVVFKVIGLIGPRLPEAINPDLSSGLMAGAEGRLALFVAAILASGYDNGPATGPGGWGSTGPGGSPSWIAGTILAGQGACGSASMRCHAAVIASAHGQVAWIFRRRRRPPRTSRAAEWSTR